MGRLLQLGQEETPEGRHDFSSMAGWTEARFRELLKTVELLRQQVERMGRPVDHPFFGSKLTHLMPQDRDDLARALKVAEDAIHTFTEALRELASRLSIDAPEAIEAVDNLATIVDFISRAPDTVGVAVKDFDWRNRAAELNSLFGLGEQIRDDTQWLLSAVQPDALDWDTTKFEDALRLNAPTAGALGAHEQAHLRPILDAAQDALLHMRALVAAYETLCGEIGISRPSRLSSAQELSSIARRIGDRPDMRGCNVDNPQWLVLEEQIRGAIRDVQEHQAIRNRWGSQVLPDSWGKPVGELRDSIEKHRHRFLRFLSSEFRMAKRQAAALFSGSISDASVLADGLSAIERSLELQNKVEALKSRAAGLLGPKWGGVATNVSLVTAIIDFVTDLHRDVAADRAPFELIPYFLRDYYGIEGKAVALEIDNSAAGTASAFDRLRKELTELQVQLAPTSGEDWREQLFRFMTDTLSPLEADISALMKPEHRSTALFNKLSIISKVRDRQSMLQSFARLASIGTVAFPGRWASLDSHWGELRSISEWGQGLRNAIDKGDLPTGLLQFFDADMARTGLGDAVTALRTQRTHLVSAVSAVMTLAQMSESGDDFVKQPLPVQEQRVHKWIERLDDLTSLMYFNRIAGEGAQAGVAESVNLATFWPDAAGRLTREFERSWYTGVMREALESRPPLLRFERANHEEIAQEFKHLDRVVQHYNRAKVALRHWQNVPRQDAGGALGWLRTQFGLNSRHKPIRTAMSRAGGAIQDIKPVFLMSPLSIAMYLPQDGPRFDMVIFDEASQVKPEDAFGGILRAKQLIIVGDSKQMPPTSFFDKLTSDVGDGEDMEETDQDGKTMADLESVLALTKSKLPEHSAHVRDLRWHYRSKHEGLIATSNRLFYRDRLVVFPSPWSASSDLGLILRHDPKTVYGRGGSRKNVEEARQVAKAALQQILRNPSLTLGIAAFSMAQQEAIQDELDLLRQSNPAFAEFDSRHQYEPLFVKNLENVQGDERDVIFISVGYGRDENGFVSMSFGPLNREGGERRLNVLITRARVRCEIFTNIKAGDIRMGENPARGVEAFRTFLAFADSGSLDVPEIAGKEPMSPFEEAVLDEIRREGYEVEPQIGSCGFYVDLGVRHPANRDRFVLGIECDGAKYHSARSARDRDKLRQQVLESRGWRIHRIWSTAWWHHPDRELKRAIESIQRAIALEGRSEEPNGHLDPPPVELVRDEAPVLTQRSVPMISLSKLSVSLRGQPLHEVPTYQIAEWVAKVVRDEAPVHIEEVVRRIREAAEVGRAGSRIRPAIDKGAEVACRAHGIHKKGEFLYVRGMTEFAPRRRDLLPPNAKKLDYVAPEEIQAALHLAIEDAYGIEEAEAMTIASRYLGFDRTTVAMQAVLSKELKTLIGMGRIEVDGGVLKVCRENAAARRN